MDATNANREVVKRALIDSDGKVKVAIIMILLEIDRNTAVKKLDQAKGYVRDAL